MAREEIPVWDWQYARELWRLTAGASGLKAKERGLGRGLPLPYLPSKETVADPGIIPTYLPDEAEGREPILVVDDDPQTLMYIRSALSESGYTPIVTASAEEALKLLVESRPHLVLLDLMLPGSDGIELMGEILAITEVPVIFVSRLWPRPGDSPSLQ